MLPDDNIFRHIHCGTEIYACRLASTGREAERNAVRLLMQKAAGHGKPQTLSHMPSGKPYIEGKATTAISITHCHGLAAMALNQAGHNVGIDAESASRNAQLQRVAGKFLSHAQAAIWGNDCNALLRAWTIKEALYKASGIEGLPLHEIPLPASPSTDMTAGYTPPCRVTLRGRAFTLYSVDIPWFAGTVTVALENCRADEKIL